MTPSSNDPAEARKRRKEIIQSQRSENELIANGVAALASTAASLTTNGTNGKNAINGAGVDEASDTAMNDANGNGYDNKPPKKRKVASGDSSSRKISKMNSNCSLDDNDNKSKKIQIRYDPEVPMSKDQLAAWRREARRVRNRESAAASRQRIRNRISELEDEVGDWKAKYSQAIQRLDALEKFISAKMNSDVGVGQPDQQTTEQQPHQQQPQQQQPPDQPAAQPAAPSVAPTERTKDSALI